MTYIDVDIFRLNREGREGKFLTRVDHRIFNKRCTISTPPASGYEEQMYLWNIRCCLEREVRDLYEAIEWAAQQPGVMGM